jgi:hypothetical protein
MKKSTHISAFTSGDEVNTVWGAGKVQRFRQSDGLYVVLLDNWKLAQGQSPTLYLGADSMEAKAPKNKTTADKNNKTVPTKAEASKAQKKSSCVIS